jgi:hypothetical protein
VGRAADERRCRRGAVARRRRCAAASRAHHGRSGRRGAQTGAFVWCGWCVGWCYCCLFVWVLLWLGLLTNRKKKTEIGARLAAFARRGALGRLNGVVIRQKESTARRRYARLVDVEPQQTTEVRSRDAVVLWVVGVVG